MPPEAAAKDHDPSHSTPTPRTRKTTTRTMHADHATTLKCCRPCTQGPFVMLCIRPHDSRHPAPTTRLQHGPARTAGRQAHLLVLLVAGEHVVRDHASHAQERRGYEQRHGVAHTRRPRRGDRTCACRTAAGSSAKRCRRAWVCCRCCWLTWHAAHPREASTHHLHSRRSHDSKHQFEQLGSRSDCCC